MGWDGWGRAESGCVHEEVLGGEGGWGWETEDGERGEGGEVGER